MINASVSTSPNKGEGHRANADLDAALKPLDEWWGQHHRNGLDVRHRTGVLLNTLIGTHEQRRKYCDYVVKRCTEKLGVSQSDVSRMMAFASHFKTLEDFTTLYPEAKTWNQVKLILPTLRKALSDAPKRGKKSAAGTVTPTVNDTVKLILNAGMQLAAAKAPKPEQKKKLGEAVAQLLKTAEQVLGVQYTMFIQKSPPVSGEADTQRMVVKMGVDSFSHPVYQPATPMVHQIQITDPVFGPATAVPA